MKGTLTNSDVFNLMEKWAPKRLAYDWDNVGLQIGSYEHQVNKIMITLDVLESVVDEAIEKGADLIIAHHPLLFKPLRRMDFDTPQGRTIKKLVQNNISVYASHTNLDAADGGVNDILCDLLGINNRSVLVPAGTEKLYKIAVFVPESHRQIVMEALSTSGAGHIGDYSHCTFQTSGQGTFKPLEGTNPFIGKQDELEVVDEVKIETIVQEEKLQQVILAMLEAHPYEEAAYDIYPLQLNGKEYGIGRIGTLEKPQSMKEFCEHVKKVLDLSHLRLTGDLSKKVTNVAILGGSGEKYIHAAKEKGADVYITGDMTFHPAQDADQLGLSVIDPGHYIEKVMKKAAKQYLDKRLKKEHVEIIVSETDTNPFQFI
nr:Nif3-like dinuclear metal center hexameric protein [Virgibacillus indicus]